MKYELPKLDYAYDALEPYIDEETMRIHHTKHHQKYIDNFNEAVKNTKVEGLAPEEIFLRASKVPDAVAKNAGQTFNHTMFWKSLSPDSHTTPDDDLTDALNKYFGGFQEFKNRFSTFATATFGSGWTWLISKNGKLAITSTSNHINPLMDVAEEQGTPLFCIDVWEHAYYLKYRNKRADYVEAFWNVLNWKEVNRLFHQQ